MDDLAKRDTRDAEAPPPAPAMSTLDTVADDELMAQLNAIAQEEGKSPTATPEMAAPAENPDAVAARLFASSEAYMGDEGHARRQNTLRHPHSFVCSAAINGKLDNTDANNKVLKTVEDRII